MIEKKTLIQSLSFAAYFALAFLIFLFLLFPFDRVRQRLESEVRSRTPVQLSVARITPVFFNRFILVDVVVSDKQGQVLFESPSVSATVSLFSLLRGAVSVNMKATAYGGELFIKMRQNSGKQYIIFDANGLDVATYSPLKDFGLKLSGKIGGNFEINGDAGKGRLWLKDVTSRELKVKGFPVPDLDFEKGWLEADLKGDRIMVRKFELDGKELKVRANGDMVLRERGTMNLSVKLKPSERMAHEQSGILAFLKTRDSEGFYQVTLGGLLSAPMPRF